MSTRRLPRNPATAHAPVTAQAPSPEAIVADSTPTAERLAYSVDEAARLTGLSRDLLYDEMRRGHLHYLKVGRRRLITRQHLEQFLAITPASRPAAHRSPDGGHRAAADAS
jgi:excisionase family DNA binding protein